MDPLPVLVEEWQFTCCGDPFAIGDLVRWRLSFSGDGDLGPNAARVTVDAVAGPSIQGEHRRAGSLLTVQHGAAAGVTAFGPPHAAGTAVRLTGAFAEDHHDLVPDVVPLVLGRIARIRAARVAYEAHGRVMVPDPATWELDDITSVTDHVPETGDGAVGTPYFLVDLQVVDPT
ncbi:hypothetical protein DY240_06475 [Jiangella rhizosphaerae]|uniref:Uncharacterized protein n=2 Tax=Jiangella rhizosphaerae TaxID=2293569 RepID=A0A418KU94_9ACTN|nr:hypothetical protein DY240_06475 [Jiangella rhizosphaerae]